MSKGITSRAADLLTRSVVVIATAAWCASSTLLPRLDANFGIDPSRASIFKGRPITPVDSSRTSSAETWRASATAAADLWQSWYPLSPVAAFAWPAFIRTWTYKICQLEAGGCGRKLNSSKTFMAGVAYPEVAMLRVRRERRFCYRPVLLLHKHISGIIKNVLLWQPCFAHLRLHWSPFLLDTKFGDDWHNLEQNCLSPYHIDL